MYHHAAILLAQSITLAQDTVNLDPNLGGGASPMPVFPKQLDLSRLHPALGAIRFSMLAFAWIMLAVDMYRKLIRRIGDTPDKMHVTREIVENPALPYDAERVEVNGVPVFRIPQQEGQSGDTYMTPAGFRDFTNGLAEDAVEALNRGAKRSDD